MSYDQGYRPQGFSLLPTAVKNLLIINGLFFLATYVLQHRMGIDLSDILGLHYFSSEKFKPVQIITYMFMHGNFEHIFFNMFALWMFGSVLENYWGPKRFVIYYLVCGIGAALTHYAIFYFQSQETLTVVSSYLNNPDVAQFEPIFKSLPEVPFSEKMRDIAMTYNQSLSSGDATSVLDNSLAVMQQYKADYLNAPNIVGASGAVFGILLAFGMMFPNTLLYVYFAIPIKAKYFVIIYGLIELISGIYNRPGDNVAHYAHLGGMLFGFILIKYWQKKIRNNFY